MDPTSSAGKNPLLWTAVQEKAPPGKGPFHTYPGSRVKRAFFLGLAAVAIGIVGATLAIWLLSSRRLPDTTATPSSTAAHYPAPRTEIRGFDVTHTAEGQTVFRISADAFRVQHQKVGHFRFGLVQEAVLDNARIELHVVKDSSSQSRETKATSRYTLVQNLDHSVLSGFTKGRIAGLRAEPATVVLVAENGQPLSRIDGRRATVRFKQGDILFEGKVRVSAGARHLVTERMTLRPETGTIAVDGRFTMENGGLRTEGRRLVVDLALEP